MCHQRGGRLFARHGLPLRREWSLAALAALTLGLLLVVGCRKPSAPDFYAAEADYEVLVLRLGDDAYADEQMRAVISRLLAVPKESREGPAALRLLDRIDAEAKRVARERAAAEARVAAATAPPPEALAALLSAREADAGLRAGREAPQAPPAPAAAASPAANPEAAGLREAPERPLPRLCSETGWASGAGAFRAAVERQRTDGCPLVVYFGAAWCPFCKQFEAAVMPDARVASGLATALKVRIDAEGDDGEQALAKRYGIRGYPTVLLMVAPDASPRRLRVGVARGSTPAPGELVEDYREAVRYAWERTAFQALRAGRLDDAIAGADRVIAFEPTSASALSVRAEALGKKGDRAGALRDLAAACRAGCAECCRAAPR